MHVCAPKGVPRAKGKAEMGGIWILALLCCSPEKRRFALLECSDPDVVRQSVGLELAVPNALPLGVFLPRSSDKNVQSCSQHTCTSIHASTYLYLRLVICSWPWLIFTPILPAG